MEDNIKISDLQKKNAKITIEADKLRFPVSPVLYGLFFEEINNAGDGGLYGELIRNRSFEDSTIPERCYVENGQLHSPTGWTAPFNYLDKIPSWKLIEEDGCKAVMSLDYSEPLSEAHPTSLKIEVKKTNGGRIGIANEGYWGIPVKKGEKYLLSFYGRKEEAFSGNLEVTLESETGEIYGAEKVVINSEDWNKYELTLESNGDDSKALFVISTKDKGDFWLELVSLFPEKTWRGKKNGMRSDLVNMLEGLKPKFLRFPGGCFVEGFSLETAAKWKKTLGDLKDRSSHFTLWHYPTTNGLGYHEYLQFAEDMGMEMMFVVNCGITCQARNPEYVPLDNLEEWIQDMLDAIEYANGDVNTKWGALRSKNGHPEPFGLKYVEIGNENFGPEYNVRYNIFYEALKEKYPEIITIFNVHWEVGTETEGLPVEIADEHFYPDSEYFQMYHNMYDFYDRKGPKIYVGEYGQIADNQSATLKGALSEAAFMTGMERNQDIVVMSSYAPLFANVNNAIWNPDLIYFNGTSVYGTPSYYVQKIFGENRGDMVVEAKVETDTRKPIIAGGIALAKVDLDKFKEVEVIYNNEIFLKEDELTDKTVNVEAEGDYFNLNNCIGIGNISWENYEVKFKVNLEKEIRIRFLDRHELFDKQNYFQWELGSDGASKLVHIGGFSRVKFGITEKIELKDKWQEGKIQVRENTIYCYLNGKLVHEHEISEIPYLTSVTTLDNNNNELIIKMVNASENQVSTIIDIKGTEIYTEGEEIILTSQNPTDNNSMEDPVNVQPIIKTFTPENSLFTYDMMPYSLVVLKLKIYSEK